MNKKEIRLFMCWFAKLSIYINVLVFGYSTLIEYNPSIYLVALFGGIFNICTVVVTRKP